MSSFASPLQIAAVAAAVAWPLAAGLGVVAWSKARAAREAKRRARLDGQLRGMFTQLEGRGMSPRLALVVEALEEHDDLTAAADRAKAAARTGAAT
ncbi:hypothetical protein [Phenylobacterium sp. J367]|uniref:hypothetical protein n=1 Tax=Phenylobacterium sp. J367 TaxID=2898435 RepID=UPI002151326B|nr:hypothetical protein [Phenylobacterium sp. J367]MCR5878726.1 hypothetical protein [Phenylobacterium sp. J367]